MSNYYEPHTVQSIRELESALRIEFESHLEFEQTNKCEVSYDFDLDQTIIGFQIETGFTVEHLELLNKVLKRFIKKYNIIKYEIHSDYLFGHNWEYNGDILLLSCLFTLDNDWINGN